MYNNTRIILVFTFNLVKRISGFGTRTRIELKIRTARIGQRVHVSARADISINKARSHGSGNLIAGLTKIIPPTKPATGPTPTPTLG
ncbi:hypothetical protein HanRHA438_Chr01g0004651 [Helianthus annuus]|nr:hypothetical protein HanRHA438_Chr01g0004651 [Helianthus annuus]